MSLKNMLFGSITKGSVFSRLAVADERIKEAQGKIVAVNDAIAAKQNTVADLRKDAEAAHIAHDQLDSAVDDLHALLG